MEKRPIAADLDGTFTEKKCKICGKNMMVPKSIQQRYSTCSKECQKLNRAWDKNPNWKGGSKVNKHCLDCNRKIFRSDARRCKSCSHKGVLNSRYKGEENKRLMKMLNNRKRKLRIRGIEGFHTQEEWENLKKTYRYMCLCCKRLDLKLTKDHIIPLDMGGTDYIWNIQPLCGSCNSIKHTKTIDYRRFYE